MNGYWLIIAFILLCVPTIIHYLSWEKIIDMFMNAVQFVRFIIVSCTPEPRGTLEQLRNGITKIKYYNDDGLIKDDTERYIIIKDNEGATKKWMKVEMIDLTTWSDMEQSMQIKESSTDQSSTDELDKEIEEIVNANTDEESDKQEAFIVDHANRIDITESILRICGPKKNFFGIEFNPEDINPLCKAMIFTYPKGVSIYVPRGSPISLD